MILFIFPHQLYEHHPGLEEEPSLVVLIEDSLFFGDKLYPLRFHQQKLWLHRASMKRFESLLNQRGFKTKYVDYNSSKSLIDVIWDAIEEGDSRSICYADPTDFILQKRLRRACTRMDLQATVLVNPAFMNTREQNQDYRGKKKRWFMADFYRWQRKRLGVLVEGDKPVGGKWSFDAENRKKVPKKLLSEIPKLPTIKRENFDSEAIDYVQNNFGDHPGNLDALIYPTSHQDAKKWFNAFLANRFTRFGVYEDAIVENESWLWHSVLTPALNIGLLTPHEVIRDAIAFAEQHDTPLNSVEGFVRQIIGWREFMRATYEDLGVAMRTTNHWQHKRLMPKCFYDATTEVAPIDDTIRRILNTGYCHHIERLMVLGGFMFLCEIDPDEVYKWFMEMFVDSYDWVMVPNVYAMSQNADGGNITTKPYFSGSSYVRKMSHHKVQPWCEVWDGLYWRWIILHEEELSSNPRWSMMCAMARKMDAKKREKHMATRRSILS